MDIKITPDTKTEQRFIKFQCKLPNSDWGDINVPTQTDPVVASKILYMLTTNNPNTMEFRALQVTNRIETTLTLLPYLVQVQE